MDCRNAGCVSCDLNAEVVTCKMKVQIVVGVWHGSFGGCCDRGSVYYSRSRAGANKDILAGRSTKLPHPCKKFEDSHMKKPFTLSCQHRISTKGIKPNPQTWSGNSSIMSKNCSRRQTSSHTNRCVIRSPLTTNQHTHPNFRCRTMAIAITILSGGI